MAAGKNSWRMASPLIDPRQRQLLRPLERDAARVLRNYERLRMVSLFLRAMAAVLMIALAASTLLAGTDGIHLGIAAGFVVCFFLMAGAIRK
jgi:hypothetical protein